MFVPDQALIGWFVGPRHTLPGLHETTDWQGWPSLSGIMGSDEQNASSCFWSSLGMR